MKRLLLLLLIGCAAHAKVAGEPSTLQDEAGFMTMEPVSFFFHYGSPLNRLELRSSTARIWYSFHPADRDPVHQPIFVFFNGGPGSAVSSGLMSMYTSRYTLDNRIESGGGEAFIPNPYPWTRFGNLLYIDPRQTGFSYNVMEQVTEAGARFQEYNAQNFNPFYDAADYLRVLLRFLARHPELRANPVVIVGESYGGVRAIAMLHLLLNYADYANQEQMYQDRALAEEIQAHLEEVFPAYRGRVVPPEVIARQFGHQILVEPALSMDYQVAAMLELWQRPDSVLFQIGREVGIPYNPRTYPDPYEFVENVAGRDAYIYTKPTGWMDRFFGNAGTLLRYTRQLSLMTGMDVARIAEMYASNRANAYRVYDTGYGMGWAPVPGQPLSLAERLFLWPAYNEALRTRTEPGDLHLTFGTLQPWDRYFVGTNMEANLAFYFFNVALLRGYEVWYGHPRFGRMFLQNVAHVRTFITNAALDLVIYSEATPPALGRHTEVLSSVQHQRDQPTGAARPGQITLNYRPDAFPGLGPIGTRTIRFPLYASSCHAVSLTQPEDFFRDVMLWLAEDGMIQE